MGGEGGGGLISGSLRYSVLLVNKLWSFCLHNEHNLFATNV